MQIETARNALEDTVPSIAGSRARQHKQTYSGKAHHHIPGRCHAHKKPHAFQPGGGRVGTRAVATRPSNVNAAACTSDPVL